MYISLHYHSSQPFCQLLTTEHIHKSLSYTITMGSTQSTREVAHEAVPEVAHEVVSEAAPKVTPEAAKFCETVDKLASFGINAKNPIIGRCDKCRSHLFVVCHDCTGNGCEKCKNFGLDKEQLQEVRFLFGDLAQNIACVSHRLAGLYLIYMKLCNLRYKSESPDDMFHKTLVNFCQNTLDSFMTIDNFVVIIKTSGSVLDGLMGLLADIVTNDIKRTTTASIRDRYDAMLAAAGADETLQDVTREFIESEQNALIKGARRMIADADATAKANSKRLSEGMKLKIIQLCTNQGPSLIVKMLNTSSVA